MEGTASRVTDTVRTARTTGVGEKRLAPIGVDREKIGAARHMDAAIAA